MDAGRCAVCGVAGFKETLSGTYSATACSLALLHRERGTDAELLNLKVILP